MIQWWFPALLAMVFSSLLLNGCGTKSKSERDFRREQIRNTSEVKRRELEDVRGSYIGILSENEEEKQTVSLFLDVKDFPMHEEGQVDPILVPKIFGQFRFNFGGQIGGPDDEFISFTISQAEYDQKRKKINLVVSHEKYKEMNLELEKGSDGFKGSWSAPAFSLSGKISLKKNEGSGENESFPTIRPRGVYNGILLWEKLSLYQYGRLTITTKQHPTEGLLISATIRGYFGKNGSTEYVTYHFGAVDFNPISGQINLKDPQMDLSLTGKLSAGKIQGEWFTNFSGAMGQVAFRRNDQTIDNIPENFQLITSMQGGYRGEIKNLHPEVNLPERILMSFVSAENPARPFGVSLSGNLRVYLGPFDSMEYVELPFNEIDYNFFTRRIVAKTSGQYHLTFKGLVDQGKIEGDLEYDALGTVASFKVGIKD